ncbi:hypothetical protein [Microseira sp. BLCC-F43]|uniref:CRISPR-associated protein Cas4 n=1 Tax=Microseira sp. BLCC-F43 TaxID=3153602 RepID=UPI0035B8239C
MFYSGITRSQDAAVFAGRRLHSELEKQEDEEWEDLYLESEELGLRGRVDALRTRDRQIIPYEHKRGRCHRDENNQPQAWESDMPPARCANASKFSPIVVSSNLPSTSRLKKVAFATTPITY